MYFWTPPVLNLELFHVQNVSWWSDKPTLMTPFCQTLKGKLAQVWSARIDALQATRVGYWISFFKPCIVQNWWYLLASADANFVQTVLLSWIYLLFSYIFVLKSTRIYVSFASASIEGKFLFRISKVILGRRSVKFCTEQVRTKMYIHHCLIFARTSRIIWWKYWAVSRITLKDAKIWSLSWFGWQPTVISVWNCFFQ